MAYDKINVPNSGEKISFANGTMQVPDNPILLFIEGDGIGYDIMTASKRIWDAAVEKAYGGRRQISWLEVYAGEKAAGVYAGDYMPEETFEAFREYKVGIKGPLTTPVGGGFRSLNVTLRQVLDLYSCVRPVRWYNGVPSPLKQPQDIDVVIFRENTKTPTPASNLSRAVQKMPSWQSSFAKRWMRPISSKMLDWASSPSAPSAANASSAPQSSTPSTASAAA